MNIPARPSLNATTATEDRVWNTIIRGDHQINSSNTYSVRWLREQSPQLNQIVPTATQAVTVAAAREESDVDQTLAFDVNSVLSNTKVSTLRLTWTRENVTFANSCFNTNGRDLSKCPVTLSFQDYIDQQDNTAQARINDGLQAEETVSWFLPGRRGDHALKLGAQYEYSGAANTNQGNMNGTFTFGLNDQPFDAGDPRTYPDRFSIRVGGPSNIYEKVHYVGAFAQDKWRFNSRLTLSLGVRYDLEIIPIPENEGPSDFDVRHNFTFSGTALVPRTHGLNVSWVARALSGGPFNLTNGAIDPDLNGIQAEPLAAGDYTGTGTNAYAVKGYRAERNGARGPGFFNLDMRFGYRLSLSNSRRVEIAADVFNLTNRTNFANPTGNQTSPQFLLLTAYSTSYAPRKLQVGARFQF